MNNQRWADYLVSAVRYEERVNGIRITHFKVHTYEQDQIGGGITWTREEVIDAMLYKKTFLTIQRDAKGQWLKGQLIQLKDKNGQKAFSNETELLIDRVVGVASL